MNRRDLLARLTALATLATIPEFGLSPAHAQGRSDPEGGQSFSFDWLKAEARRLAQAPFQAPSTTLPDWIANLDWDGYTSYRHKIAFSECLEIEREQAV